MTIPDKLKRGQYASIERGKLIISDGDENTKSIILPKWLVDEIQFKVEMAHHDGMNAQIEIIKNALRPH